MFSLSKDLLGIQAFNMEESCVLHCSGVDIRNTFTDCPLAARARLLFKVDQMLTLQGRICSVEGKLVSSFVFKKLLLF